MSKNNNSTLKTTTGEPLSLTQRVAAPTPPFFKKVRTLGLILGAIGATLLAAPVGLPAVVVTIGSYLALAGGVMTTVAQTATEGE